MASALAQRRAGQDGPALRLHAGEPDRWIALYEWLRDSALVSLEGVGPDREGIAGHFGPSSPSYQRDIAALKTLYQENAELETIRVKRRLWYDLLRTALGEIAYSPEAGQPRRMEPVSRLRRWSRRSCAFCASSLVRVRPGDWYTSL